MKYGIKIKNQENFLEKYQYVEWDKIKWLNEYSPFLGFMSFYNLASTTTQSSFTYYYVNNTLFYVKNNEG